MLELLLNLSSILQSYLSCLCCSADACSTQVYSVDTKWLTVKDKLHGDSKTPLQTREHNHFLSLLTQHVFDSHEQRMEDRKQEQLRQEQREAERRKAAAARDAEVAKAQAEAERKRMAEAAAVRRRKLELLRASMANSPTGRPCSCFS